MMPRPSPRCTCAGWQTAYRGIFPDAFLDGMMDGLAVRTERWRAGLAVPTPADNRAYVIEDPGSGMVGFVSCGSAREVHAGYPGELYAIYLLAEHRGQGLGRALFGACRDYLASLGHHRFYLWVIDSNPTCGFYRTLGGTVIAGQTKQATIGGTAVTEIAFISGQDYGSKKIAHGNNRRGDKPLSAMLALLVCGLT